MSEKYNFHAISLIVLCFAFLFGCSAAESGGQGTLTVSPDFFRVPDSEGRVQFSAKVSGVLDENVTWSLLSGPGTIDPNTGLYVSEAVTAQVATATVQATRNRDAGLSGTGKVGLTKIKKAIGEPLTSGVVELAVGGLFVRDGQTIDLNDDNNLDLVARNPDLNQVSFLLGNGNNTFEEKPIPVTDPVAMVVGDFVGVLNSFAAELAVASGSDQKIHFISSDTTGQQPPSISQTISLVVGQTPVSLAAGKFHGSFLNDFPISDLIVGTAAGEIIFFRQDRSQLPFTHTETGTFPVGGKPIQMIVADFDRNTTLDLAVVREGSKDLFVLFGNGQGSFSSNTTLSFPGVITYLAEGDFNGDDIPDLVAAHAASSQISVLLGNGDGSFGTPLQIPLSSKPGTITIGDFNVGTNDDIAIALPDTNELFVLYGNGLGKFTGNWRFSTGALSPTSLISGFFTGFDAPQGFQSIDLIYMGSDLTGSANQFFLLSNQSN